MKDNCKLTIQFISGIVLLLAGIVLLFLGFFADPTGEIHPSVLTAFGEALTFIGAVFGIDYSYKFKRYKIDRKQGTEEIEKE